MYSFKESNTDTR